MVIALIHVDGKELDAMPDAGGIWRAMVDASPSSAVTAPRVLAGKMVIPAGPPSEAALRAFVERMTAVGVSLYLDGRIGAQPSGDPATDDLVQSSP